MSNYIPLIPLPENVSVSEWYFKTYTFKCIDIPSSFKILKAIGILLDRLSFSLKKEIKLHYVSKNSDANIFFLYDKDLWFEEYKLIISVSKIDIYASSNSWYLYAFSTIFHLIFLFHDIQNKYPVYIPCLILHDTPRFHYRGLMLDVARHFISCNELKKIIEVLWLFKINKLHLHISDDQWWRIEIKKYPNLCKIGSIRRRTIKPDGSYSNKISKWYYSQKMMKEIVKFAGERWIEIIPEIDLPWHSSAILASYPELCDFRRDFFVKEDWWTSKNLLIPNKKTFQFLEDIITEIIDIFPSRYIHLWWDECNLDIWNNSKECEEIKNDLWLQNNQELLKYFFDTLTLFVEKRWKELILWDDVLDANLEVHRNRNIMSWRGISEWIDAVKKGNKTIFSPHSYLYFSYYQSHWEWEPYANHGLLPLERVYSYEPLDRWDFSQVDHNNILWIQSCIWTEYISHSQHLEYMLFPRLLALSELSWSKPDKKNYQDFLSRLAQCRNLLDFLDIHYKNF